MRKTVHILVLYIFIMINACNKLPSNEELIRGDSYKYWVIEEQSLEDSINIVDYLDKNGKWLRFEQNNKGKFIMDNDEYSDFIYIKTWELKNDSIINFGGTNYNIIKLTIDTMIIYNKESERFTTFISLPDSIIPSECRTIL